MATYGEIISQNINFLLDKTQGKISQDQYDTAIAEQNRQLQALYSSGSITQKQLVDAIYAERTSAARGISVADITYQSKSGKQFYIWATSHGSYWASSAPNQDWASNREFKTRAELEMFIDQTFPPTTATTPMPSPLPTPTMEPAPLPTETVTTNITPKPTTTIIPTTTGASSLPILWIAIAAAVAIAAIIIVWRLTKK